MDHYKHKSGAQKRKEKERKVGSARKGLRTLFDVGLQKKKSENVSVGIPGMLNEEVEPRASTSCVFNLPEENFKLGSPSSSLEYESEPETCNIQTETAKLDCGPSRGIIERSGEFLDIGDLTGYPSADIVESFVRRGPSTITPENIPSDGKRAFPRIVLHSKTKNGELLPRDWLCWSGKNQSLYCFPCRLLSSPSELTESNRSVLMSEQGWRKEMTWRKLYDKLPIHETSAHHKKCYIEWRALERRLKEGADIQSQLDEELKDRKSHWQELLQRVLAVILFLAERGLPFRGESTKIGDPQNGNFLGIIELLSEYDPLLREHIRKVKEFQQNEKRLQAHYLSWRTQNEFIEICGTKVLNQILFERQKAKYYAILVDATPDLAHEEQLTFILRYVSENDSGYKIEERFLSFVKCNNKTGEDIANKIVNELAKHEIPLNDCRGQGFDNGANMVGVYKGVKTRIAQINPYALFSNCAAHSLNLCGVNAAESCQDAVLFFGILQQLYKFFSKSPQRWEILENEIKCSLHKLSDTRWSARVDAVKPFAKHLPGVKRAVTDCMKLNMSAESKTELLGIENYLKSFKCILMATIWFKILVSVDHRNKVLQAREVTLDEEISHIDSLIKEMNNLRDKFDVILQEAKLVANTMASQMPTETEFIEKRKKKRKHFHGETSDSELEQNNGSETKEEREFKINVFFTVIDSVISGLRERFHNARKLSNIFQCLWQYLHIDETAITNSCQELLSTFPEDLSGALIEELIHLKSIHTASFGASILTPFKLINKIKSLKLESIFPNVCIATRLFCTLPVSVAGAERSFSALKRIKNYKRSTMGQERLCGLTTLAMEPHLARSVDFSEVIQFFADKKARKMLF